MYNFVGSVCLSRSIGSQWHDVDLSNILVFDIYATYSKVFLVLYNDVLVSDVYVDLDTLKAEFSSYNDTLANLLVFLANRTLPTVSSLPSTTIKVAKYSDAIRSNYKVNITKIGVVTPDNYPDSEKHDLEITRPNYATDLQLIHDHCLVSVNGYYHMTDADGVKAYVYKGGDTMRKSRSNHLGILSFLDMGVLTKIPIAPANITGQTLDSPLKDKIYFSVDENLDNKSYILVLGGYLVFPSENIFWRNGDNSFALDLNNLPYLERIYESRLYMDMSGLELTEQIINPDVINAPEAWSDRVIKNYLTLSQSYLVLVDTPNLLTNKINLRHSSLPGMFTAYQEPVYPLVVSHGKVAEYWKVLEDGHWAVNVQDSFLRNYVLSQQPGSILENINSNLEPNRPFFHSRGYLLEIQGY